MADFFNAYGGGSGRWGDAIGQAVGQASAAGAPDQIAPNSAQGSGGPYTPMPQDFGQWGGGGMGQAVGQAYMPLSQLARGYGGSAGAPGTNPTFAGYDPANMQTQQGFDPATGQGWSVGAAMPSMGIQTRGGDGGYGQQGGYGRYGGGYGQPPGGYLDANTGRPAQGGGFAGPGQAGPLQGGGAGRGGAGSFYGPAPGGASGGTVLLRAPNGQTRAVPADQVAHYVARGATRV